MRRLALINEHASHSARAGRIRHGGLGNLAAARGIVNAVRECIEASKECA